MRSKGCGYRVSGRAHISKRRAKAYRFHAIACRSRNIEDGRGKCSYVASLLTTWNGVPAMTREHPTPFALRVLVIDHSTESRESHAALLKSWGHLPILVESGQQALQRVETDVPHVVLLNLTLPGADGMELAKTLCGLLPKRSLLIALSREGKSQSTEHFWAAGCDYHLASPVDPERLRNVVDEYVTGWFENGIIRIIRGFN